MNESIQSDSGKLEQAKFVCSNVTHSIIRGHFFIRNSISVRYSQILYFISSGLNTMTIVNTIDEKERIIYTTCVGVMETEDFDSYLIRIWGNDKYFNYNELFNTVSADWSTFEYSYLLDFAQSAAKLKTLNPKTKLAWVILEDKQKMLTEFYKSAKLFTNVKSRELELFESKEVALQWLQKD